MRRNASRGRFCAIIATRWRTTPISAWGGRTLPPSVDFTTLMRRGEELGLQPVWFGEQCRFLLSAGIVEEIEESERSKGIRGTETQIAPGPEETDHA